MSTLSGQASKGEKTKSKFQSLDINSLYRDSRGENTEKTQQKRTSAYLVKHGMQSLGKVPNTRRAPANLPSLKSESSETGAAVPLVPPGGPGWGKQDSPAGGGTSAPNNSTTTTTTNQQPQATAAGTTTTNGTASTTTTTTPPSAAQNAPNPQSTAPQSTAAAAAAAAPNSLQTTAKPQPQPGAPGAAAASDKLWSSITSGGDAAHHHPPPYHSLQFRNEFPSLSGAPDGGAGGAASGAARAGAGNGAAPDGGGPSLRPQTEGSWTQGGRMGGGQQGAQQQQQQPPPPMALPQAQHPPFPPQFRSVMPSFMYKGSFGAGAPAAATVPTAVAAAGHQHSGGSVPPQRSARRQSAGGPGGGGGGGRQWYGDFRAQHQPPRQVLHHDHLDELTPRPIIKEEELNRMDEIASDIGWAIQDDIDYTQTFTFSDEEGDVVAKPAAGGRAESSSQREATTTTTTKGQQQQQHQQQQHLHHLDRNDSHGSDGSRNWGSGGGGGGGRSMRGRSSDEDDMRVLRRTQQEVDLAVQRAKQRKEEEEKRFNEATKQGAAKKLMELEEKIHKRDRISETSGTINPASVPQKTINHTPIPLPEFQKDKDSPNHQDQDPSKRSAVASADNTNNFRHLTQIEGKSFPPRKPDGRRLSESADSRDNNIRTNNSNNNNDNNRPQNGQFSRKFQNDLPPRFQKNQQRNSQPFGGDTRWAATPVAAPPVSVTIKTRDSPDRNVGDKRVEDSAYRQQHEPSPVKHEEYDEYRRGEQQQQQQPEKWQKDQEKRAEEPKREDAKGRHPREFMNQWATSEPAYESYEEKRKEQQQQQQLQQREDRRVVPGPITKERIEADDHFRNEKRSLTQLKRGKDPKKDSQDPAEELKKAILANDGGSMDWADCIPSEDPPEVSKPHPDPKKDDFKDGRMRNRGGMPGKPSSWGNNDFHRPGVASWGKRPNRGGSRVVGGRPSSQISGEFHGTDSEGSADIDDKNKKQEKDDKNRDTKDSKAEKLGKPDASKPSDKYVPRGEPSRIGRGGAFGGRSSRVGGMGKKIDGYGPPPKSPFGGNHEDKKASGDEAPEPVIEDKTKLNQQALSVGMGIVPKKGDKDEKRPRRENRRGKSRSKAEGGRREDEIYDTNSELSDEKDGKAKRPIGNKPRAGQPLNVAPPGRGDRRNPPPRMEKRYDAVPRQNSSNSLKTTAKKDEQNVLCNAIADIGLKNRDDVEDKEERASLIDDSEGFQEVKSKKTVKEKQKIDEKLQQQQQQVNKSAKPDKEKDGRNDRKKPMTSQQIHNIPSLMATPVNPPSMLPKNNFERSRQVNLPPRFAKLQMQQKQYMHQLQDNDQLGKPNQNVNVYGMKDAASVSSAWEKPLPHHDNLMLMDKGLDVGQIAQAGSNAQADKLKMQQDKSLLDGSSAPVQTIIFENTNFKSSAAPGSRAVRSTPGDKSRKMEDGMDASGVLGGFNKPLSELIGKDKSDSIQLPISFKEDNGDMKLDFFDSGLSLTEDKSTKMMKAMHAQPSANSAMCTADSLNFKIASVKKVWETPSSEHGVVQEDTATSNFSNSFVTDGQLVDHQNVFNKSAGDGDDGHHEVYNHQSPSQAAQSASTNVCKVKPTQQVSGGGGAAAPGAATSGGAAALLGTAAGNPHQQHQQQQQQHVAVAAAAAVGMVPQSLMGGHPLSPPPPQMQHAPPPAYGAGQHLGYQTTLGGGSQYGMSAIPSPPTVPVLYNSQQANAAAAAGLYGTFQMEQPGVLGGQRGSGFSQFPPFGMGQTGSSPYSTQSVYLQTAPPPPPQAAQAPPPDLYQNFRLGTAPYGQSQQLSNPSTVLISSTSNTLMSASVKPSSQQISAIGTKAGGVGQAYGQQAQQGQVYMYDTAQLHANYMPNLQRGPGGPVQNNVVPALQPSSSFYSGSTGGQTGYFQQGSSTMPGAAAAAAQLQQHQHQSGYGLQGFAAACNQTHNSVNFNSQFLSAQMAAALSQQYRNATNYMKVAAAGQQMDQNSAGNRPQQLKSPAGQDGLSSVFSNPQIPSPKARQTSKHGQPQPQSSPTAQTKLFYGNVNSQQNNVQRYPTPIQRPPVNFQQSGGGGMGGGNTAIGQKHRSNNPNMANKAAANRQFYGQNNVLSAQQPDAKVDESKLNDSNAAVAAAAQSGKVPVSSAAAPTAPEKDSAGGVLKEDASSALKD